MEHGRRDNKVEIFRHSKQNGVFISTFEPMVRHGTAKNDPYGQDLSDITLPPLRTLFTTNRGAYFYQKEAF